jgi:arylamine N-acetyltransferase
MTVQSVTCGVESHAHLRRLGLEPGSIDGEPSLGTVTALQAAHVRRVPFETTPRDLGYFAATNDYLSTAPESPFAGSPVVTRATDCGHVKLTGTRFFECCGAAATEHPVVGADEWFAIDYPSPPSTAAASKDAHR